MSTPQPDAGAPPLPQQQQQGKPAGRPVSALDLSRHMDKKIHVKLAGGRQIRGTLKGWDQLVNLVLDDTIEKLRDPLDPYRESGQERKLGLVVARGISVVAICAAEGYEEIYENPFHQQGAIG